MQSGAFALEFGQDAVHERMGDGALLDLQQPPAPPGDEPHVAVFSPGRKADVVAIPPRLAGSHDGPDDARVELADPLELLANGSLLSRELRFVAKVLELAPAALPEVAASGLDAVR